MLSLDETDPEETGSSGDKPRNRETLLIHQRSAEKPKLSVTPSANPVAENIELKRKVISESDTVQPKDFRVEGGEGEVGRQAAETQPNRITDLCN